MAKNTNLSKSTLIRSLQCQKSLYLYKNYYHLKDKVSAEQQKIFNRGHNIGRLAQDLFPNGKDVSPASPFQYNQSLKATKYLIEQPFHTLYEAAFRHDKVIVFLDILVLQNGEWHAFEVKSGRKISPTYILDASIQYYVISQSGLPLKDMSIIYVNKDYELKEGSPIDLEAYFIKQSILEEVQDNQEFVQRTILQAQSTLMDNIVPEIEVSDHCDQPYPCDFKGVCWQGKPLIKK